MENFNIETSFKENGAPSNIWWMDIGRASQPASLKNRLLPLSFSPPPSPAVLLKKGRVYEIPRASRRPSSLLCVVFH